MAADQSLPEHQLTWWGDNELPAQRWCEWQIGPLSLYARCTEAEWHLAWSRGNDPLDASLRRDLNSAATPDLDLTEQARYVSTGGQRRLSLYPQLADRPVIARPEVPVYIAPGQKVVLYVSTVIWLQPRVGDTIIVEIPITRPSDTWFGINTREGQLCYASITRARTSSTDHEPLPHRAATPVEIINEGTTSLQIQQIRVPVTALALYANAQGHLTTDRVRLRRLEGENEASLEVPELPNHVELHKVAEPRSRAEAGTVVQAFTNLFN